MFDKTLQQIKLGFFFLILTLLIGTLGYSLIEGWNLLDSVYMTIITITTTGFKEVQPLSDFGRMFTLLLIVLGVGAIAYTGGKTAQILLETQIFRRRRMSKKLEELKDHYIVCGYGRMGRYICEELQHEKLPFVVIESSQDKIDRMIELDYLYINGDATKDEVLLQAEIKKAKGLVAVLSTDAENVFAILTAKQLNPEMFVVARAVEEETESKLVKAGANRVVKPYEAGGTRMAELLIRPGVINFIDNVARDKNVDLNFEEVHVCEGSSLISKSLAESPIRKNINIIIVSIEKKDGKFIYNPRSSTIIEEGDKLIAIGEKSNLNQLSQLCVKK